MKIMILSDSHSMTKQTLLNFINQHPADYYIHCGDIYMPYSPLEIDNFYNVRGNNDFETFYILQFLKSVQEFIFSQARGSAQPHVYPKDIESLKIIIPNEEILHKYGEIVYSMNEKITNNLKQNQELSALRDWLLPMLMNGQVKVG